MALIAGSHVDIPWLLLFLSPPMALETLRQKTLGHVGPLGFLFLVSLAFLGLHARRSGAGLGAIAGKSRRFLRRKEGLLREGNGLGFAMSIGEQAIGHASAEHCYLILAAIVKKNLWLTRKILSGGALFGEVCV